MKAKAKWQSAMSRWQDSRPNQCGHCGGYTQHVTGKQLEAINYLKFYVWCGAVQEHRRRFGPCDCRVVTRDPTQQPSTSVRAIAGGLPSLGKKR